MFGCTNSFASSKEVVLQVRRNLKVFFKLDILLPLNQACELFQNFHLYSPTHTPILLCSLYFDECATLCALFILALVNKNIGSLQEKKNQHFLFNLNVFLEEPEGMQMSEIFLLFLQISRC